MSYDQIDALRHWRLLKGSHEFPGKDGGTCINEAAIVAAGLPYRPVVEVKDMPPCFSRVLSHFAMLLNDTMRNHERQCLIPFVMRLAGTADTGAVEYQRARFLQRAITLKMIPRALRAIGKLEDADLLEGFDGIFDAPLNDICARITVPNQGVGLTNYQIKCINSVRFAIESADWVIRSRAPLHEMSFAVVQCIRVCAGEHRKAIVQAGCEALEGALAIGRKADPLPEETLINNLKYRAPQYAQGGLSKGGAVHTIAKGTLMFRPEGETEFRRVGDVTDFKLGS